MKPVFADTGYWIAFLDARDPLHERAQRAAQLYADRSIVTSELVLVEVLNHFSEAGPHSRRAVVELISDLRAMSGVQIVPLSHQQFDAALALYAERPDKPWSLVDCASFLVMQRRRLSEALAHDRHFEQAGFRPLLRTSLS